MNIRARYTAFAAPDCVEEFKKDPEKYIKKIEAQGITLEKCTESADKK